MAVSTLGWIFGSVASSTVLILINKHIFSVYKFESPLLFASYHFFMTWGLLEIMCRLNKFPRATMVPQYIRWRYAIITCGAVVLMNLNLKLNSVGFYQLSKLAVVPYIVLHSYFVDGTKTESNILFSLGLLLVGIALFSVSDLELNFVGSIVAIIAVVCVATSQMGAKTYQSAYDIGGQALQHATALQQFAVTFFLGLVLETHGNNSIFMHNFKPAEVVWIFMTGFIAVSVNVCAFCLIGKTSAITYQVVGHMKSILIFIFGFICFPTVGDDAALFIRKIIGLCIAMGGVILYSVYTTKNKEKILAGTSDIAPDKTSEIPVLDDGDVFQEVQEEDENEEQKEPQ